MNETPLSFYEDRRIKLFKATQEGKEEEVKTILQESPDLLRAKTTTKNSSLLHIAAERGHKNICVLLLNQGHETNPVDKNGKTPYERTTQDPIKRLLAARHKKFLCDKYYTANVDTSKEALATTTLNDCLVMERTDFEQFLSQYFAPDHGDIDVSAFTSYKLPTESPIDSRKITTNIQTYFREDILMIPFHGDLLVIHENEQAIQFIEETEKFYTQNTSPSLINRRLRDLFPQFETRAYFKNVSEGLRLFPFLNEYPKESDTPDVILAKKMFVASTIIGAATFYQNCSLQQRSHLATLPFYRATEDYLTMRLNPSNNGEKNKLIYQEIHEKYFDSNKDKKKLQR